MIVAVLGGRARARLGGAKATAPLRGEPLIARPLAAARAAGLDAVVVAKRDTALPPLDVPVWIEPDEPYHPLSAWSPRSNAGRCVAVACDQPWVTAELLRALADARAVARVDGRVRAVPGPLRPAQLPVLREALAERGLAARDAGPPGAAAPRLPRSATPR